MSTASADDDDRDDRSGLSALWWQHAASFTVDETPVNDSTGIRCISGQHGDVWFLHGSFGNEPGFPTVRDCTVPKGVTLFFPIVNLACVPFPGETIEQNRQFCKEAIDLVDSMSLEINGRDRTNKIKRVTQSRPFALSLPEDNVFDFEGFDAPAGTYLGVADGYYAAVKLTQGIHTIHIKGGISAFGFGVDVIYNLRVVRPETSITPR